MATQSDFLTSLKGRSDWRKNSLALALGLSMAIAVGLAVEGASAFLLWIRGSPLPRTWTAQVQSSLAGEFVDPNAGISRALPWVFATVERIKPITQEPGPFETQFPKGFLLRVGPLFIPEEGKHFVTRTSGGRARSGAWYEIDKYHRRRVPADLESRAATEHLILLGCSFTFGEGLAQEDTLAAGMMRLNPQLRAYNYAFVGYSPQNNLYRISQKDSWDGIREEKGTAIYLFIRDHVNRFFQPLSHQAPSWTQSSPYVVQNERGELEFHENSPGSRPLREAWMTLLGHSSFFRFFAINWPPFYTNSDYRFLARIFVEMKNRYLARFPDQTFQVVFYPTAPDDRLKRVLNEAGVATIDYSTMPAYQLSEGPPWLADGHPSAALNRALSEQLSHDLRRTVSSDKLSSTKSMDD